MEKTYFELRLPVEGFNTDLFATRLHEIGCLGIYEPSADEWVVYLPGDWTPEHKDRLIKQLLLLNPELNLAHLTIEEQPYQNWNAEWRKYFTPTQVSDTFWVRPPWEALPEGVTQRAIIIDPQMAFGTGHHETTRLMLQMMEKIALKGKAVLDLGCGSGILSFAAKMLGADSVIGIDIDPDAIENALHNAKLNQCEDIVFTVGNISQVVGQQFPIILANIQFHILEPIRDALYQTLSDDGRLLISGILAEEADRFIRLCEQIDFKLVDRSELGEWAAMTFKK